MRAGQQRFLGSRSTRVQEAKVIIPGWRAGRFGGGGGLGFAGPNMLPPRGKAIGLAICLVHEVSVGAGGEAAPRVEETGAPVFGAWGVCKEDAGIPPRNAWATLAPLVSNWGIEGPHTADR